MQFLHPALLWALPIVAIPIVIHLLNKARFRVVRWGPMRFLLQAERENRRRIRLEHLLLLLLRCLALVLLAFLVARPLLSDSGAALIPGAQEPVEQIVILDDSGSMGYRSGRSTSWDRARRVVQGLLEDLRGRRPRDFVTCLRTSRATSPDLRLASPGSETDAFVERLKDMQPSQSTCDLPAVLEAALLQGDDEGRPQSRVVTIVTDFRHRDWVGKQGDLPAKISAALTQALAKQEEGATTRVVVADVGGKGRANLGIESLQSVEGEKLAMRGVPTELELTVKNFGTQDARNVPLTLTSGDGSVTLPPIATIKAGETISLKHKYTFLKPGSRWLTAQLTESDALPLDDARHLALRVQDQIKVLLINGEEGVGALGHETAHLRLALAPPDAGSGIQPAVVLPQALANEDLSDYSLIVACNLGGWPREQLADLKRFVRRGGGLAFFLGNRVNADSYGRTFYEKGAGLLPCQLGPRTQVNEEERPRLLAPAGRHPLITVFEGEQNPMLERVRAQTFMACPVDPNRDRTSQVVLRLENRVPFVVVKPYGQGKVVLFNTTADQEWSSWPREPSFLITMHELVKLLAPSATAGLNTACGEPIVRPINPARIVPVARVEAPPLDGKRRQHELHAEPLGDSEDPDEPGSLGFRLLETARAGVYTFQLRTPAGETRAEHFAANLVSSEGDLTPADTDRVQTALPEDLDVQFVVPRESESLLEMLEGSRWELWRTVLLLLVGILVAEQTLAWFAAHHRKGSRKGLARLAHTRSAR